VFQTGFGKGTALDVPLAVGTNAALAAEGQPSDLKTIFETHC
jgi:hypothetical protein